MIKLSEILLFIIAIFIAYIAVDIARYTDFARVELKKQSEALCNIKQNQLDVIFKSGTLIINDKEIIK